jgi:hypothetical protein
MKPNTLSVRTLADYIDGCMSQIEVDDDLGLYIMREIGEMDDPIEILREYMRSDLAVRVRFAQELRETEAQDHADWQARG